MHIRLLIIFSLLTLCSFGQGLDIENVYNFSPAKLSKAEQEIKLPTLDGFWDKVKSDTAKNLPLLRNALNTPNHNPFFYYDGSVLLISLTKSNDDKTIAANAIAKCDLADINEKEYVETINRLSNDGVNVTEALNSPFIMNNTNQI